MSTFLEDPRLRQRWNQISHTTETVTENAAAGIWSFQHNYINPCLSSLSDAVEPCIAPCFGDRDERARWARAREHHQQYTRAEYTFDFYDDWDDDDELLASSRRGGYYCGSGGGPAAAPGSNSRGEDWDRLIGGSGAAAASRRGHIAGEVGDQPRRKRGMSYGTRGGGGGGGSGGKRNSKSDEEDLTIIPSTAPLGFLSRLPWKFGGTLRYKPSAAFLQDHPGGGASSTHQHHAAIDENQPLLESSEGDEHDFGRSLHVIKQQQPRKRSSTGGSGDTSDSFRSRGDLFPSDGEEYDDAMEIDDEFAVALERVDDRASSKTTPSSKGKRPAGSSRRLSRTISGTTISTRTSKSPLRGGDGSTTNLQRRRSSAEPSMNMTLAEDWTPSITITPSIEDLQREEEEIQRQEDEEIVRKREAASQLARERGLSAASENNYYGSGESESRAAKSAAMFQVEEVTEPRSFDPALARQQQRQQQQQQQPTQEGGRVRDALHDMHVQDDVQGDEDVDSKSEEQQQHHRGDTTQAARSRENNNTNNDDDDETHRHPRPRPLPAEDDFIPARLPNFQ